MKRLLIAASLMSAVAFQAEAAKIIPANSTPVATTQPAPATPPATTNRGVVAASTPAAAPAPAPAPRVAAQTASIDTGFYFGAQLGDSSVGAVMGYQFSKMIGMEISYDYFDPIYTRAVTTTIADKNRLGASMLAMFPVKFSEMGPMALYVKVGYARTTDKVTTDDPGLGAIPPSTFITTTTKTGVTGGAGIHVDMSQSTSVRVGVNVVGAEHTTYLAALYRF